CDCNSICIGLLPDVGIFPSPVCGGERRKLLQGFCQNSSRVPIPPRLIAGPRCGSRPILLFAFEGCDRCIGSDSAYPAVPCAGSWSDRPPYSPPRLTPAISHVALSLAGPAGERGISVHLVWPSELAERSALCRAHPSHRRNDLHGSGMEAGRMA